MALGSVLKDCAQRDREAWEQIRLEFISSGLALAIRKMHSNFAGLWIYDPDFFRAVGEVLFHLEIELRSSVGVRSDLDGQGGRTFEVSVQIGSLQMSSCHKAVCGQQKRIRREQKARGNEHSAELTVAHVRPKEMIYGMPNIGARIVSGSETMC